MKYKTIIGGTIAEALAKFPWLADASFEDAVIDITNDHLIWMGGVWKDGIWEGGTWEDGIWEGGTWKRGIWYDGIWDRGAWRGGIWERGLMWSNISQKYERVSYEDGKFTVAE